MIGRRSTWDKQSRQRNVHTRALDWIVLKAIDKDRIRRYPTAGQLAADIEKYLHDEPVEARPPSRIYLFRKFARRHRGLLIASAAVLATLFVGIVATGWAAKTAFELKAQAQSRERQAIRAATAAGASMLLPAAETQRLAEGWLAEIEELKANQLKSARQLTADIYDRAKKIKRGQVSFFA